MGNCYHHSSHCDAGFANRLPSQKPSLMGRSLYKVAKLSSLQWSPYDPLGGRRATSPSPFPWYQMPLGGARILEGGKRNRKEKRRVGGRGTVGTLPGSERGSANGEKKCLLLTSVSRYGHGWHRADTSEAAAVISKTWVGAQIASGPNKLPVFCLAWHLHWLLWQICLLNLSCPACLFW